MKSKSKLQPIYPERDMINHRQNYLPDGITPHEVYQQRNRDYETYGNCMAKYCYDEGNFETMVYAQALINYTQGTYRYSPRHQTALLKASKFTRQYKTYRQQSELPIYRDEFGMIFVSQYYPAKGQTRIPLYIFNDETHIPLSMKVINLHTMEPVKLHVAPDLYIHIMPDSEDTIYRFDNGNIYWFKNQYGVNSLHQALYCSYDPEEWIAKTNDQDLDHSNNIRIDLSRDNLHLINSYENRCIKPYEEIIHPITNEILTRDTKHKLLCLDIYLPYIMKL